MHNARQNQECVLFKMQTKNIFEPYLKELHQNKYSSNIFWLCIPKKFCDSIKEKDILYICPKCANPMNDIEDYHCIKGNNIKLKITLIEKWFLTEINNREANKIGFTDRMHLINFLDSNYGYVWCNESLLEMGVNAS